MNLIETIARTFRRTANRRRSVSAWSGNSVEPIEQRLLLASVYDSGTDGQALTIQLDDNETLSVVAESDRYVFSTNTSFSDGGLADPDVVEGLGTQSMQFVGLLAYSSILVTSDSDTAAIQFMDSSDDPYAHEFRVESVAELDVMFQGKSDFGSFGLSVQTQGKIVADEASQLTVNDGSLTLMSGRSDSPTSAGGIVVDAATVRSLGEGDLSLGAFLADLPSDTNLEAAVMVNGGSIRSLLNDNHGGSIIVTGSVDGNASSVSGIFVNAGEIVSAASDFDLVGAAGRGGGIFLQNAVIQTASDGNLKLDGAASGTARAVVQLDAETSIRVQSGDLMIEAISSDAQGDAPTGIVSGQFSMIESVDGPIRIQSLVETNAQPLGVDHRGRIESESGSIDIDSSGWLGRGDLRLSETSFIGNADDDNQITLRASDFDFESGAQIQTTGQVAFGSNATLGFLTIGASTPSAVSSLAARISQDELAVLSPDISQVRFGVQGSTRPANTIHLGPATFKHDVHINATEQVSLSGDVQLSGHELTINGPTDLDERVVTIDGDVTLQASSLSMGVGQFSDHLKVNGKLTLEAGVAFHPVWKLTETYSARIIAFESLEGRFHVQPPESTLSSFPGAWLAYQSDAMDFRVNPGASTTQIVRAEQNLDGYGLIQGPADPEEDRTRVEEIGDVNGDGRDDLLFVPALKDEGSGSRTMYLVPGREDMDFNMDVQELTSTAVALTWADVQRVGGAISHADLNGDGLQDMLIGGSYESSSSQFVHVILGRPADASQRICKSRLCCSSINDRAADDP